MQQSELIGYTIEDNMKFPAEARSEAFDRDKAKTTHLSSRIR